MLKKVLNLRGVHQLSKNEQKVILGGFVIPKNCCDFEIINGRFVCTYRIQPGQYCP